MKTNNERNAHETQKRKCVAALQSHGIAASLKHLQKKAFPLAGYLGCHQRPDRSFFFFGRQFPICARCTGVCLGQLAAIFLAIAERHAIPPAVGALFCLVMLTDWLIQRLRIRESTNVRRLLTGALCGFGYINILFVLFIEVFSLDAVY
jgi:uncharacterized membrane protein